MLTFYFTATGNSLYVAKKIGGELLSIPQILRGGKSFFCDDSIGFVFPCYCWGVPRIVRNFIKMTKFEANFFFAVMTYGNISGSATYLFEKLANKNGINIDYLDEILMVDNYLPFFAVEKQLAMKKAHKIQTAAEKIATNIKANVKKRPKKSIISKYATSLLHGLCIRYILDDNDESFLVNENCNTCGVCSRVCPVGNIMIAQQPDFSHRCESCFACIHLCPQKAIHLKGEKSGERFINQAVSLQEIIAANIQTH